MNRNIYVRCVTLISVRRCLRSLMRDGESLEVKAFRLHPKQTLNNHISPGKTYQYLDYNQNEFQSIGAKAEIRTRVSRVVGKNSTL